MDRGGGGGTTSPLMLATAVEGNFELVQEAVPSSWLRAKPFKASHTRLLIDRECDRTSGRIPRPVGVFGEAPAPA